MYANTRSEKVKVLLENDQLKPGIPTYEHRNKAVAAHEMSRGDRVFELLHLPPEAQETKHASPLKQQSIPPDITFGKPSNYEGENSKRILGASIRNSSDILSNPQYPSNILLDRQKTDSLT